MFLFTALLLACACWRQAELPGRWRSRGASIVGQEMQPGFCAGASKQTARWGTVLQFAFCGDSLDSTIERRNAGGSAGDDDGGGAPTRAE